jgi:hypothetical protein
MQLHRLADARDFVPERMIAVQRQNYSDERLVALLIRMGSPKLAFVISESEELDRTERSLTDAVSLCIGLGLGSVVSCLPGRLCFFQEETVSGRWILTTKK